MASMLLLLSSLSQQWLSLLLLSPLLLLPSVFAAVDNNNGEDREEERKGEKERSALKCGEKKLRNPAKLLPSCKFANSAHLRRYFIAKATN